MKEVRLRFAPSPTGHLHIGGLRTALYNYLFARGQKGKFILRIEDTDQDRFVEGAIEGLTRALKWSGVEYDEGVFIEDGKLVQKGEYGPYIQSERLDIYRKYVDQLIESGHAYYCFCSKERLDEVREKQKAQGKMPKYDGFCRSLSLEEAKKRVEAGEDYVVRMKLPVNYDISFNDLVRGQITINSDDSDDQVLLKTDGFPTYHMAVVVDDHLMEISHVVRGEEWLSSTPKHVYLYEALGWEKPTYVHLPTVLNKNRKKLSKREGDAEVEDFQARGYLPQGLVNYLALVGWSPESNEEILSMDQLIEEFSFDRVSRAGGIFDKDKLDWVNAHYMKELSDQELTELILPFLIKEGLVEENPDEDKRKWLDLLSNTVKDSLHKGEDIIERSKFIFNDSLDIEDEEALEVLKGEGVRELLETMKELVEEVDYIDHDFAKSLMKNAGKKTGLKGKNLFMPGRVALTGMVQGPELANVIELLGKENLIVRLNYVMDKYL